MSAQPAAAQAGVVGFLNILIIHLMFARRMPGRLLFSAAVIQLRLESLPAKKG